MKFINRNRQYLEDQEVTEKNSKHLLHSIAHQQYTQRLKKFRQLFFDSSSCTEDNDTKNSDILCREYNKEIIKI